MNLETTMKRKKKKINYLSCSINNSSCKGKANWKWRISHDCTRRNTQRMKLEVEWKQQELVDRIIMQKMLSKSIILIITIISMPMLVLSNQRNLIYLIANKASRMIRTDQSVATLMLIVLSCNYCWIAHLHLWTAL